MAASSNSIRSNSNSDSSQWHSSGRRLQPTTPHLSLLHTTSCHGMSSYVMSHHVMTLHVTSCHVMACHLMSCHGMSWHILLEWWAVVLLHQLNRRQINKQLHAATLLMAHNNYTSVTLINCNLTVPHRITTSLDWLTWLLCSYFTGWCTCWRSHRSVCRWPWCYGVPGHPSNLVQPHTRRYVRARTPHHDVYVHDIHSLDLVDAISSSTSYSDLPFFFLLLQRTDNCLNHYHYYYRLISW